MSDQLGVGGTGIAPGGDSGPSDGTPALREHLRALYAIAFTPYANVAALVASLAKNRADGQIAVKLDDYTSWKWQAADTTPADTAHLIPTDVGLGAGRWVRDDGTIIRGAIGGQSSGTAAIDVYGTTADAVALPVDTGYVLKPGVTAKLDGGFIATDRTQHTVRAKNLNAALRNYGGAAVAGAPIVSGGTGDAPGGPYDINNCTLTFDFGGAGGSLRVLFTPPGDYTGAIDWRCSLAVTEN